MPSKMTITAMLTGREASTAIDGVEFSVTPKTPPRPPIVRPGAEPTHDDPAGGKRWHYLNLDGSKMDPCSFVYEHVSGGFGGECGHYIFPDGYSPAGPATMDHIRERIEAKLIELGFEVIDPPEWWTEAQIVRKVLTEDVKLAGPYESTGEGFQVVDAIFNQKIALGGRSPSDALQNYIKRLSYPRDNKRVAGNIQAVTIQEPTPFGVTVTLPDGTRIDIGHKPAR